MQKLGPPILLAALLGLCVRAAFAQPPASDIINNLAARNTTSLDGTWNAIVDPYESGLGARFYENAKPKSKSDLIEYSFDTAGTLKVPGDWNTQRTALLLYEGPAWYQRYFSFQKRRHTRVFLYFGAANYQARVWLNGKKLGEHVGGFTPFNFEITGDVLDGQNSLVVEVNNLRSKEGVPALSTDWWNYGGLTRSVALIEAPETFIQDYVVQLAKASTSELAGWVRINGATQPQTVTLEIPEIHFRQSVTSDASGYAEFRFPVKVQLWSPEEPKLYRVTLLAADDAVEDEIGFRSLEVQGKQILLNGKPVFLRGISMHEEAPYRAGRVFSEPEDRILLDWAKELGCNFVRLAHYPYNEAMVRLADRLGLLVWEEIPVYWGIAWDDPGALQNAEEQLRDVIARDHNRAAIALWSLSNETSPISASRLKFLGSLADYARSLDNTRLITSATNHVDRNGPTERTLSDPLGQYLDVLGLNEYLGWYEGKPEDADQMQWKISYDKPLIVSEFGGGAQYGKHGSADERFTEEYQANLFEHQLKMLPRIPGLAGMSPWVLMDFRSPRRMLTGIQDFYNRKGLISDRGQHKQAFYVLQSFYRETAAGTK